MFCHGAIVNLRLDSKVKTAKPAILASVIRRLVVIAFCIVVCAAQIANSLCFTRCAKSEARGTHHSCAPERTDATAISAAPHTCSNDDEAAVAAVEVRHAIGALALP